jgi:hypothetical protein
MHEVDSQSDPRLTQALRHLAASSRQGAPPEIGAGLLSEFRRRHIRRTRIRRTGVVALAVCIGLGALRMSSRNESQTHSETGKPQEAATGTPEKEVPTALSPSTQAGLKQAARRSPVKPAPATTNAASRAFLALPGYDPAVPLDELQVVRVKLPASALWKIGAPVGADAGEQAMTADFMVSQDGTAYAVRLVQ